MFYTILTLCGLVFSCFINDSTCPLLEKWEASQTQNGIDVMLCCQVPVVSFPAHSGQSRGCQRYLWPSGTLINVLCGVCTSCSTIPVSSVTVMGSFHLLLFGHSGCDMPFKPFLYHSYTISCGGSRGTCLFTHSPSFKTKQNPSVVGMFFCMHCCCVWTRPIRFTKTIKVGLLAFVSCRFTRFKRIDGKYTKSIWFISQFVMWILFL